MPICHGTGGWVGVKKLKINSPKLLVTSIRSGSVFLDCLLFFRSDILFIVLGTLGSLIMNPGTGLYFFEIFSRLNKKKIIGQRAGFRRKCDTPIPQYRRIGKSLTVHLIE